MDFEKYFNPDEVKGRYQQAVAESVCTALIEFCGQEQEFEQAVEQSGKTFQDCLDECIKGVKGSISDIELYRKAVSFYFKGADISFSMKIMLSSDEKTDGLSLSLDELLEGI